MSPRAAGRGSISLFDLVFMLWAIAVPTVLGHRVLNNDGDLPRHLRLGTWILDHRTLPATDVFSFTKAGQPFLAFEWGSEVVYAALYRVGGLAAVSVGAGLLLGLTYALAVRFLLRRGVEPLLAYCATMIGAMLGALHWVARPHLFTLLLVVILLDLLDRPSRRHPAWIVLLFAAWANLHGGFFYGLVLIGLFLAGDLVEAWLGGDRGLMLLIARARALTFAAAAAGACLTPHGLTLYRHVAGYFGSRLIMNETQEFMSPDFHVLAGKFFLAVLLLIILGLALVPRRPSAHQLLVLAANLGFSLISARNIALFGLTAVPLVALHVDADWRRLRLFPRARQAFADEARARWRGAPSLVVTALLLALALAHGRIAGRSVVADRFDPTAFPVAMTERARAAGLGGRVFSEFTWEGYLLLAWPERPVFIDPGTDHYGEAISADYIRLWNLEPRWDQVIDRWRMTTMLLPRRARLAYQLAREPGWRRWGEDSVAVVFTRAAPEAAP